MTKALPLLLRPMLKSFLPSGSDREPSRSDAASISATGKDLAPASHGFNHAACFIDSISVASSLSALELFTRFDTAHRCR